MAAANPSLTAPAAASIFSALGDPTRLSLLTRLSDGRDRSIASLSEGLAGTRQAITKHLRVLEAAGLVGSRKVGRESRFVLRPDTLADVRSYLDEVSAQWEDALGRLKTFAEE